MVNMDDPEVFAEFLTYLNFTDEMYDALRTGDPAELVMTALSVLRRVSRTTDLKTEKCEAISEIHRRNANDAYVKREYQLALEIYNRALLFAPVNSESMKLAYSNRSAVLFKMKAYQACLKDIDTCFSMGCPRDIVDKLKKRKHEAYQSTWTEKLGKEMFTTDFNQHFFDLNVNRNPQIPAASADIGVVIESQIPKIVALNDIQIGTVLAVETAFVSNTTIEPNQKFSCYHCHKICLNLIPCDGCVHALFCSENCKSLCFTEYHHIECQIMGYIGVVLSNQTSLLILKAVLKMKSLSTWKEFIAASNNMGIERIKNSSINEIFVGKFAGLCYDENKNHFVIGQMYNSSLSVALAILYLEKINFFPESEEMRITAMKAFGRVLIFCFIHGCISQLLQIVTVLSSNSTKYHESPNYGFFSFMGKLKHDCDSNSFQVALNNKIALVALKPIKRGSEITASRLPQWLDLRKFMGKKLSLFRMFKIACDCPGCSGRWEALASNCVLNNRQKSVFQKLNVSHLEDEVTACNVHLILPILSKALIPFSETPYCHETVEIRKVFRKCILILQDCVTCNVLLDLPS